MFLSLTPLVPSPHAPGDVPCACRIDQADESNIMLVLSIYNRVIDVVRRLFGMIDRGEPV